MAAMLARYGDVVDLEVPISTSLSRRQYLLIAALIDYGSCLGDQYT
ncbi:hypothetical protein ACFV6U_30965 [Streptomyces sp. NPDC059810]